MDRRTKQLIVMGVVGIALGFAIQLIPAIRYQLAINRAIAASRVRHPDLYHLPSGGVCASGYLKVPAAFSAHNFTCDACWNGYAPPSIDFLLDDEDVSLGVKVPR